MEKIECFDRMEEIDCNGHDGIVYRISKSKCVKILRNLAQKYKLENESKIAKFLFERGVSVPRPYGVVSINSPYHHDIANAFIMEYIDGCTLNDISGMEYRELSKRTNLEYIKVKNLRVYLTDNHDKNVLYSEKKDKIYLIDFSAGRMYEF